ncbi:hypothetical protein C8R43DRAFT_490555 [Mycena crocata]|nr:hypothetical protein C8R43DRAFT_490555 [Mycena crocata]
MYTSQAVYHRPMRHGAYTTTMATEHIRATVAVEAAIFDESPELERLFAPMFRWEAERKWRADDNYSLTTSPRGLDNGACATELVQPNALTQWTAQQLGGSWPARFATPAQGRKKLTTATAYNEGSETPHIENGTTIATGDVDLATALLSPQARDGLTSLSQNKSTIDSDVVLGCLNAGRVPEIWNCRKSAVSPVNKAVAWEKLLSPGAKQGLADVAQGIRTVGDSDGLLDILNTKLGDDEDEDGSDNRCSCSSVSEIPGSFEALSEELYRSELENVVQNWRASIISDETSDAVSDAVEAHSRHGSSSLSDDVLAVLNTQPDVGAFRREATADDDWNAPLFSPEARVVLAGLHTRLLFKGRVTSDEVLSQSNGLSEGNSDGVSEDSSVDGSSIADSDSSIYRASPATSMTSQWVSTSYVNTMEVQQGKLPAWVVSLSMVEERLGLPQTLFPLPKDYEESEEEPWN